MTLQTRHTDLQSAQRGLTADPASEPERPTALTPDFSGMPSELAPLQIWVCWRYEWDGKKRHRKVPYIPIVNKQIKAKSNDPRTWRTLNEAKAAYLSQRDFFDGVGICAAGDLVFGDFDHAYAAGQLSNFAATHMPPSYSEQSPGGDGAHFIAHGTIDRARKKARGELYAAGSPRFLTMTGRRLPNAPGTINHCQEAIDRYATALDNEPGSTGTGRSGTPRTSTRTQSRKQLAAEITESVRDEARDLYRTQGDRLERRFKAGAWKEETQWWFVSRCDYTGFHARYPFVGLYDADGTFDPSQARMATGRAIRGLGFTLPEYAALMTRYFANDRAVMLARWGNKDVWWEELADIWNKSAPAKRGIWQPKPAVAKRHKPVGRASDHAAQVERVYILLQEHRVGDTAIIKTADLATEAGMHRVTLAGILAELREAQRIQTKRIGRYGGLTITFLDVAIVAELPIETPAEATPLEETHAHNCVSSEIARPGYSSESAHSGEPPTLVELARAYLSDPAIGQRVNTKTGQITNRHTAKHFADLVTADYPYTDADARAAYTAEQQRLAELERQGWQRFFARLRHMTDDELIAYIAGRARAELISAPIDHTEEQVSKVSTFDAHLYKTRLKCAKQHLAWRGLTMPSRVTTQKPVTPRRRVQEVAPAVDVVEVEQVSLFTDTPPAPAQPDGWSLIARLQTAKAQRDAAHVE